MGIHKASKAKNKDVLFRIPLNRYFSTWYIEMSMTLGSFTEIYKAEKPWFFNKKTWLYEEEIIMMNQKNCMPVGDYFITAIELKPVEDKVLNKYGRTAWKESGTGQGNGLVSLSAKLPVKLKKEFT